jgi:predicted component of type VI protein secretion system
LFEEEEQITTVVFSARVPVSDSMIEDDTDENIDAIEIRIPERKEQLVFNHTSYFEIASRKKMAKQENIIKF